MTVTVQAFGTLTRAQQGAVAEEGERMLTTLSSATAHDIRFGTFSE